MVDLTIIVRSGPRDVQRVAEGLRLSAAMLGMDEPPNIVFLDEGVRCLLRQALTDQTLKEYLRTAADLAGVQVLSESMDERGIEAEDLDPSLSCTRIGLDGLAEMISKCTTVVAF